MHPPEKRDLKFETEFFESVLRRDRSYTEVIELLGGLYTQQGRIEDGLRMDRRLVKLKPDNATARYNLACSLALMNKEKAALDTLDEAIALGYDDHQWMEKDADLKSLRGNTRFEKMLAQLRQQDDSRV